jgi:hypothetical protein
MHSCISNKPLSALVIIQSFAKIPTLARFYEPALSHTLHSPNQPKFCTKIEVPDITTKECAAARSFSCVTNLFRCIFPENIGKFYFYISFSILVHTSVKFADKFFQMLLQSLKSTFIHFRRIFLRKEDEISDYFVSAIIFYNIV